MALHLVAIAGSSRGEYWPVDQQGLVLGRDADCDIIVQDPTVSRRHCKLSLVQDEVRFEDLGSRNPALVNGRVVTRGALKPGDEISLGQHRFILTHALRNERRRAGASPSDTWSWKKGQPFALELDSVRALEQSGPDTLNDLVLLYEIPRELSRSPSLESLLGGLHTRLLERFSPVNCWIGLNTHESEFSFYHSTALSKEVMPITRMKQAQREQRGLLFAERETKEGNKKHVVTMVVPLVLAEVNLGVLVLQAEAPVRTYSEEDLRFLVLLAQSVAPPIWSFRSVDELRRENERLRAEAGGAVAIIGESRAIKHIRKCVAEAAKSNLSVLITGETGTGKELVARRIHALSSRRARPLVVVNCAAIPRDLFESQLFGYEKGAFTGALEAFDGLLAQADQGTVFLDEVGDLSLDNQARVLRAIELGTFRRIGAAQETHVDIRVIAATNKKMAAAVEDGSFRRDLFHRLNGFEIEAPPLRDRPSDIPILAQHFFETLKHEAKRPLSGISPEAIEYLRSASWPGNVRELRNRIQRAIAISRHDQIQIDGVWDSSRVDASGDSSIEPLSLAEVEKRHIIRALQWTGGNIQQAAKLLQIGRTTLYSKLAEYNIQP